MRGGLAVLLLVSAAPAFAAKDGPGPDKVVEQLFRAYSAHRPQALKKLLVEPEGAAAVFGVEERWFELPPFKKAWAQQQAQLGVVAGGEETATVAVSLLRLNLGPLALVDAAVEKALAGLPPPQQEKRRKPLIVRELRAVSWTYDPVNLTVGCRKIDGKWRIESTGLGGGAPAPAPPPAALTPSPEPPDPAEVAAEGFRVNKADLAAYPEALKIVSVEGQSLDSAFRGKVVVVVRNQGRLALRGFHATVVYQSTGGDKRVLDPQRSFVAPASVICPGATAQTETEAMAPGRREGASDRVSLQELVVEIDRPDAFGRLLSQSCAAKGASP